MVKMYLTDTPGCGGKIRVMMEDFLVEEVLPFQPTGTGEHYLVKIEKTGISTLEAIQRMAKSVGLSKSRFGYAGLKDARAIARQWISVWSLGDLQFPRIPDIQILEMHRHSRKLNPGALLGNRFKIIVRETTTEEVEPTLEVLDKIGVPNFFGPQRFGSRRPNTHLVGKKIVQGDIVGAVDAFVGNPYPTEHPDVQSARSLYDKGDLEGALRVFPRKFNFERSIVQRLIEGKSKKEAFRFLPRRLRQLFVHAYQSYMFNQVLCERMEHLTPMEGDYVIDGKPTGPLFGYKMKSVSGYPGELEKNILEAEGVKLDDFKCSKAPELSSPGLRLPLVFDILEWKVEHNPLTLYFSIPKGCYATSVLREVMKTEDIS